MPDFVDDLEMDLGRLPDIKNAENASPSAAQQIRRALRGKHVCPFCGTQRETDLGACLHCSLEDTPTTRSATRSKLGPWYVLQSRNPSAPGMNFATLMVLVQKNRVTARSVIRGPTTGQFWRHAAKVKGVSREFGLCWNCGGDVAKNARACPACKRLQEPPLNPDVLLEATEVNGEDLAEAMWSDNVPASSQMPGSSGAGGHGSPRQSAQQVDRLVSRGGVRREIPTPQTTSHRDPAIGHLPPRPQRGLLGEGAEELPPTGLEMAVFQMPHRFDTHGKTSGGGGRRVVGKLMKVLLVALLLGAAGVVAICSFDPSARRKAIDLCNGAVAKLKSAFGGSDAPKAPPGFQLDRPEPAPGAPTTPTVVPATPSPSPASSARTPRLEDSVVVRPPSDGGAGQVLEASALTSKAAVPATTTTAAAAAAGRPRGITPEEANLKVWEFWRVGKQAEQRGDFSGAVRAYEAIKALPVEESAWPLNLNSTIDALKKKIR
jgi:hypothetical protein